MAKEAGKGEHKAYRIVPNLTEDNAQLKARDHYLGIDAVSWYINKESSWFSKRMASGTLEIKLANGLEKYQAALGTFSLKGGAKFAPIFQRPVLPDRNYRGGPITFTVHLTAVKKDTTVGGLLKNAANASLGIVAGMVDTASVAGPAQLLTAASGELVSGVRSILSNSADGRESVFEDNGFEVTIQPSDVIGPSVFLLFHRGTTLEENKLDIKAHGELLMPVYDGSVLEDGAWLLMRVRRTDEYNNVRPWFPEARELRGQIDNLVYDFVDGVLDKNKALEELAPTEDGNKSLFDRYMNLRTLIRHDGVLTEREATSYVVQIRNRINVARREIEQDVEEPRIKEEVNALTEAIISGSSIPQSVINIFEEEAKFIKESRNMSLASSSSENELSKLGGEELIKSMKYIPNSFDLSHQ